MKSCSSITPVVQITQEAVVQCRASLFHIQEREKKNSMTVSVVCNCNDKNNITQINYNMAKITKKKEQAISHRFLLTANQTQ